MTTLRPIRSPHSEDSRSDDWYASIVTLPFDLEPPIDVMYQEEHVRAISHSLRGHFHGSDTLVERSTNGTLVSVECTICYDPSDLRVHLTADLAIAFGVDIRYARQRNAYVISEMGKPPEFVLEAASPSTADEDTGRKRRIYAQIGVQEYWCYDKSGGDLYGQALSGDRLMNGVYQPIEIITEPDGEMWGYSAILGLSFCYTRNMLLAYNRETGQYLLTDTEEHAAYREVQDALDAQRSELEAAQARVRELEEQLHRREPGEGSQG